MALKLCETEPDTERIYICTPTGDELPEMFEHWKRLEGLLDGPVHYLGDKDIYTLIHEANMLPNWRARWCTRILKIEVAQEYYLKNLPATVYVGLRADEEREGNKIFDDSIKQRFPLQEWGWGIRDVLCYLDKRGVKIPIRTDCAMCFYQRIGEWWNLWMFHRTIYERIEKLEDEIGHTLMSPGKHKIWPHALKDLKKEFESGRVPRGANIQGNIFNEEKCRACTL